jgi:putative membrane protein
VKKFIHSWLVNTLAVLVAFYLVKGIHYDKPLDLCAASLILGILNSVIRPLIMLVALPLVVLTLGLFAFVINAALLYFVGYLLRPHFYVDNFSSAFWGAVVITIVSVILNSLTGMGSSRIQFRHHHRPPGSDDDGGGPVIDV